MIPKWNPTPARIARPFLNDYSLSFSGLKDCAARAEELIKSILKPAHLEIHQVSARAKGYSSMRLKLRMKKYLDPINEVTDQIGVRIITYFSDDVDRVTELLKLEFEIDYENSEDKRLRHPSEEFGYRSVHLIARLKGSRVSSPEYESLRNQWFEIQIRSVLEHAWAEIEHEVKYKPRIDYPKEVIRRFARIAGVLELLDAEFLALRAERLALVEMYRNRYLEGLDEEVHFDSARLLGFLEAIRPDGLSWRAAAQNRQPFPTHVEASCIDALATLRLNSPSRFKRILSRKTFRNKLKKFAQIANVSVAEISHLAIVLLVVIEVAPGRIGDLFSREVVNSSEIREMLR